jgi:hypothetical protein
MFIYADKEKKGLAHSYYGRTHGHFLALQVPSITTLQEIATRAIHFEIFQKTQNLHNNLYFAKNKEKGSCIFQVKITVLVLGLSELHCQGRTLVSEKAVRSHAYIKKKPN